MAEADDRAARRRATVAKYDEKMRARRPEAIAVPTEKRCAGCGEVKPAEAFGKSSTAKSGLQPRCKVCLARAHAAKQDQKGRKRRISASLMAKLGMEIPTPPIEETPDGLVMRVPLGNERFAVIDASDWPLVSGRHWHMTTSGYAVTNGKVGGKPRLIYMHIVIFGDSDAPEVDHRDLDKLNNRRGNLRPATSGRNKENREKPGHSTSPYKGVSFHRLTGKWRASVSSEGVSHYLGLFSTPEDAAAAYDKAATRLHGEFARLNKTG